MKKINVFFYVILSLFSPVFSFAQGVKNSCEDLEGARRILCEATFLVNAVIPFLIALGVVYFVWGVVQYVIGNEEEAKTKGRSKMIWGLIGLTVIVSVWGLVSLIKTTVGIGNGDPIPVVCVPGPGVECEQ